MTDDGPLFPFDLGNVTLRDLFAEKEGISFLALGPNSKYDSTLGNFETNDGVLTVRDPDL